MRSDKGYGSLRIHQELHQRGIDEAMIDALLADSDIDWLTHARKQYRKRFGNTAAGDFKDRAKRSRFLQYRGYPHDIIRIIVEDRD